MVNFFTGFINCGPNQTPNTTVANVAGNLIISLYKYVGSLCTNTQQFNVKAGVKKR